MSVTGQQIATSFIVRDLANTLPLYDRIRWFRSIDGPDGFFEDATAETAQPAQLTSGLGVFKSITNTTLVLRVDNGTDVSITFTSPAPVSAAFAASEINSSSALLNAVDVDDRVVITTVSTGSGASLEVLEGTDAFELDFAIGAYALGKDEDFNLISPVHEYIYTDQNSSPDYWYRTQFWHSSYTQNSVQSAAFPAGTVDHVAYTDTITGQIRLSDMAGRPIPNRKVTFHNTFSPSSIVSNSKNWGVFRHAIELRTDESGYGEIRLVRGMEVDMAIDGTGYTRRIKVPTVGDVFDLLDPALSDRDEFGIRTPTLDYAIRTS